MNKQILLIEDDSSLREIYSMALELDGYIVKTAVHGKEALTLLVGSGETYMPDCIVTDLRMPVMNGETFIEILRTSYAERFARVPIIVCTAHGANVNKEWIYSRIQKPLSLDLLISTVELAIRKFSHAPTRELAAQL
jgi:CheY-like chemotaxis protein